MFAGFSAINAYMDVLILKIADELVDGAHTVPTEKADPSRAVPNLGVGLLAFSANSRYLATRCGEPCAVVYNVSFTQFFIL